MALQIVDALIGDLDKELSSSRDTIYTATEIRIKKLPAAEVPDVDKHFKIIKDVKLPKLGPDQLLIEIEYLSVDPYLRGAMAQFFNTPTKHMTGFQVAKVIESNDNKYKPGDYVYGAWSWSTRNVIDSKTVQSTIPPNIVTNDEEKGVDNISIPRSYYIGSAGMPGML